MNVARAIAIALVLPAVAAGASVDYVKDIKSVLATKCFACHGALKHESDLRLDAASLILKGGDSGPAIMPGKADDSLLIHKVSASDPAERMPPEGEGEPLTSDQLALLRTWINEGAVAPEEPIPPDPRQHWAYQPIAKPPLSSFRNPQSAICNPIDIFLAAAHESAGITPTGPASKETLLRRVYFDLIGLPPTRDELHAFVADDSPLAYERVVDQLLASPQYGERWGRHWMDVWRYSDWTGYGNEIRYSQRHIWRWRDWIIESLNADKGYDRIILEMLAADELSPGDEDAARATGFLARNWYKFDRNSWLDDVVDHTTKAFLGMTVKCARCHDHKYDPISQREYYSLRAIFEPYDVRTDPAPGERDLEKNGFARIFDAHPETPTYLFQRGDPRRPDKEHPSAPGVPSIVQGPAFGASTVTLPLASYYPAMRPFVADDLLAQAHSAIEVAQRELTRARQQLAAAEKPEKPIAKAVLEGAAFLEDDFSQPRSDVWTVVRGDWEYAGGRLVQKQIAGGFSPIATATDPPRDFVARLTFTPTGGAVYRSVGLSFDWVEDRDFQAVYLSAKDNGSSVSAFHRRGGADAYPAEAIVPHSIRVGQKTELEVLVRGDVLNVRVDGQLKLAYRLPVPRQAGKFAIWTYDASAEFHHLKITDLSAEASLAPPSAGPAPESDPLESHRAAQRGATLAEKKLAEAQADLTATEARIAAERAKYSEALTGNAMDADQVAALANVASRAERLAELAEAEAKLLSAQHETARAQGAKKDGDAASEKAAADAEEKAKAAEKALTDARAAAEQESAAYRPLGPTNPQTSTGRRLALARWIADRRNPLTARVAVNHIWLRHFGQPLVENVEDFGLRSPRPVHAELLDYLAAELMEHDWSMKYVHRLIVTSAAYQRSSNADFGVRTARSDNSIPQSAIRNPHSIDPDNKLFWRMAPRRLESESVRDAVLSAADNLDLRQGGPDLDQGQGLTSPRRSLYFRHARERQMEFLTIFDAANPEECYRRRESIRPQQTFAMMNSSLAIGESRRLAGQLSEQIVANSSDEEFTIAAFETVLTRRPTAGELADCLVFLESQATRLASPEQLDSLPSESGAVPPSPDPGQRARENLVLVLFNHNDFVTIR